MDLLRPAQLMMIRSLNCLNGPVQGSVFQTLLNFYFPGHARRMLK